MKNPAIYSRALAAAARLSAHADHCLRFVDKHVLITGEKSVLQTGNGSDCFLGALRLLPRMCRRVSFALPPGFHALEEQCRSELKRIDRENEFSILPEAGNFPSFDAILNVGTEARSDLPWTVINSNGWLARVSSGAKSLSADCEQRNAIAALAAASLGVAEIFKRLIRLRESRGVLLDGLTFSLHSYQQGVENPGPPVPNDVYVDLVLAGAGAIGNGVICLLRQLGTRGEISVVDRENYSLENLGTCLLIGRSEVDTSKAEFAKQWLGERMHVRAWPEEVLQFRQRMPNEVPHPSIVINALDNIDARHDIQDLWPDVIIDGAIGDFPCQVTVHRWGEDVACLRCLFKKASGEPAEQVAARATGLSAERVQQQSDVVTHKDVESALPKKKAWLKLRIGKQICSIVGEAVMESISKTKQSPEFQPSVPFVACFSASMVVGELIKYVTGERTILEPRFQFDMLWGPCRGLLLPESRHADCICAERSKNISRARGARRVEENNSQIKPNPLLSPHASATEACLG